ncbi:MAG: hypothetical protein GWN97_03665, partial [Thermoplasmata archaeon]|nr:hypothetical protein [Thermoplasmata archaeon]
MSVSGNGSVALTGSTRSTDFPVTNNAFCSTLSGEYDTFVAMLDANLSNLTYSSYFGGSYNDVGKGITMDPGDAVYVTGYCGRGFPTTTGAFDEVMNGTGDAFALKLEANGSIGYITLLGGKEGEGGFGITTYNGGCALVTGETGSPDFPTTEGAFDRYKYGRGMFISKLSPDGSDLLYSTFVGGEREGPGWDISIPEGGYVYATGKTRSLSFPTTQGAYCTTYQGGTWDSFLLRMDIDKPWIVEDSTPNVTGTGDPIQVNLTIADNIEISDVKLEYWYGGSTHVNVDMEFLNGTGTLA